MAARALMVGCTRVGRKQLLIGAGVARLVTFFWTRCFPLRLALGVQYYFMVAAASDVMLVLHFCSPASWLRAAARAKVRMLELWL